MTKDAAAEDADPYLWLEDVTGERALAWVRERSEATVAALSDSAFEADRAALAAIYNAPAQIPYVIKRGPYLYNFWRDAGHRRGLWRRTTPASYRTDEPDWEILLDLDTLAMLEGEDWVWHGCTTLPRVHTRGLVSLSRGGADAVVLREFDLVEKRFVEDGFILPEAKQDVSWIAADAIFVTSALREGERTHSGYPRTARRWQRGTPFEASTIVFEVGEADMSAWAGHDSDPGFERDLYIRRIDFFRSETFLERTPGDRRRIDVPTDASLSIYRNWLSLRLREAWETAGRTYPAGALLTIDLERFLAGDRDFVVLFTPSARTSLEAWLETRNRIYMTVLDNVRSRVHVATPNAAGRFDVALLSELPQQATIGLGRLEEDDSDDEPDSVLVTITDFLTPTTLGLLRPGEALEPLKSAPVAFDASGLEVTQHEACSIDGVAIPYFQISPKGLRLDGDNPVVMTGYGGFDVSIVPYYQAGVGKIWLERGGSLVVCNLRGGGEFGPAWHAAGRREGKRLAQDDFAAIAKDLIARGVTRRQRLGAQGGSNAGLLVGNMLTRYPELFGAIWCAVPLLDMQRYTKLLAGASWISEYGDPDDPDDWAFIQTYSPYHLVARDKAYPPVLFTTSRRDDRVHPGHARKMAAKMIEQGYDVLFYEPGEGGHGFADKEQMAFVQALGFGFIRDRLTDQGSVDRDQGSENR